MLLSGSLIIRANQSISLRIYQGFRNILKIKGIYYEDSCFNLGG